MTLVIPQHHAQLTYKFSLSGDPDPYVITIGVKVTDPPASLTPNDVANGASNIFEDNLLPHLASVITYLGVEMAWTTDPLPSSPTIGVAPKSLTGGNTGVTTIFPANCAFLAHKRTGLAGRGGRGRMYIPGVGEGQADNTGTVVSGTVTAWNGGLAAFLADFVASTDFEYLCLFHDSLGAYALLDPEPLSSITLDPVIATQRRRLRH